MRNCNTRFGRLPVDLENLFDHMFGETRTGTSPSGKWVPSVDIVESEVGFDVLLELPGVSADEVSIELQDNELVIRGARNVAELAEGETWVRRESRSGEFERRFEFQSQVEPDGVTAKYENGLLSVNVPKSAKVLPRKIEIATN